MTNQEWMASLHAGEFYAEAVKMQDCAHCIYLQYKTCIAKEDESCLFGHVRWLRAEHIENDKDS